MSMFSQSPQLTFFYQQALWKLKYSVINYITFLSIIIYPVTAVLFVVIAGHFYKGRTCGVCARVLWVFLSLYFFVYTIDMAPKMVLFKCFAGCSPCANYRPR